MKRAPLWFMGALVAAASIVIVLLPLWWWFVGQRIAYPFPIDYGEGPLLRQLTYLQQGGTLTGLYGDPGQPPYLVVNYPPVYLVVSQISWLGGWYPLWRVWPSPPGCGCSCSQRLPRQPG